MKLEPGVEIHSVQKARSAEMPNMVFYYVRLIKDGEKMESAFLVPDDEEAEYDEALGCVDTAIRKLDME